MAEITDAELAELQRLHEAATPGPLRLEFESPEFALPYWSAVGPDGARRSVFYDRQNAAFHVAASNALPALIARLERAEKERDEARTELRAFIGNVEEMTLGEGVPAGLVVMDPGSDRPRAVSSHVMTQWYEAIMDKWHRDKDDLIAMYERGQREAMHAPLLRDRVATLEAALRDCEDYFDQRADADCVGDPAAYVGNREMTLLCVVRRALRGLEGK